MTHSDSRFDPRRLILETLDDPESGIHDLFFVLRISNPPRVEYLSKGMEDLATVSGSILSESVDALWDAVHPDDLQRVRQALADPSGHSSITSRFRTRDHTWRWIEHRFAVRSDLGADPIVIGIGRDVTDQIRVRDDATQERNFIDTVLDTVGALVILLDDMGLIVRMNAEAERVTGYSHLEAEGKASWDLWVPGHEAERVRAEFGRIKSGQALSAFQNDIVTKSGATRRIEWRSTTLSASSGRLEFVVATGIDVTASEQAAREREELLHNLGQRVKEVTGLYRILSLTQESRTVADIARHAPVHIRHAFTSPNETFVRIELDDDAGQTDGFRRNGMLLRQPVIVAGSERGVIEVSLQPEGVLAPGDPFIPEERELLRQLAQVIAADLRRRDSEQEIQTRATALDATAEMVLISSKDGVIEYVNAAFERQTGYSKEEAVGQTTRILNSGRQTEAFYKNLWETVLRGDVWTGVMINRRKDGSEYFEEMTVTPVKSESDEVLRFVAIKRDISDRKAAEAELTRLAMTDPLTGLANRRQFSIHVEQAIRDAIRRKTQGAVAYLDLDGFKEINDRFGHAAGDEALHQVGDTIRKALRRSDIVARMGGDEFAVLLHDAKPEDAVRKVAELIQLIRAAGFEHDGVRTELRCSAGVVEFPGQSDDPDRILVLADIALYQAKQKGGDTALLYDGEAASKERK